MISESDRISTEKALALDKSSYKYKKRIASRIGKRYGSLTIYKFHDVHNSMYRFICKCELCSAKGLYIATFLKSVGQKCRVCRGKGGRHISNDMSVSRCRPANTIAIKPEFEFCEIEASISRIGELCFDYIKSELALGSNDGKDDKYYQAKMTVAKHEIEKIKIRLVDMYEILMKRI